MTSLLWLLDHWLILLWIAGVIAAYIYGGRYAALAVFTLGIASVAYNRGKSDVNKHAKEVNEERENAYREIENRGTDRDDVIDRLRKHGF